MNGFSRWRDSLPLPAFFVLVFVLWTGIQLVFHIGDRHGRFVLDLIAYGFGGLIFAGAMTGVIAWRRRRAGGASELAAMNRAVRTGELPEDAEPRSWDAELARREGMFARQRWLSPLVFGLFAALAVVLLALGGSGVVLCLVCAVAFAALAVYSGISSARFLAKVRSLRSQLRVGAPTTGRGASGSS